MKVILFSRVFPTYHPKKGEPTDFIEAVLNSIAPFKFGATKHHTIRKGRRWKVGDKFSARYWKGKPYQSKQEEFAEITIEKIFDFHIINGAIYIDAKYFYEHGVYRWHDGVEKLAENDGLTYSDFRAWFNEFKDEFEGQIICWNKDINYSQ